MRSRRSWVIGGIVVLAAIIVLTMALSRRDVPQYFFAMVERGEIRDVVEATGTVNAVITVQVGSQVSGTISKLNADFNSRVRQGDVIALIDSSLFQGALLQATADLESARANLIAAQSNVEKACATLTQTKADYERTEVLAKGGMAPQQQVSIASSAPWEERPAPQEAKTRLPLPAALPWASARRFSLASWRWDSWC